jgi:hypothetical protein
MAQSGALTASSKPTAPMVLLGTADASVLLGNSAFLLEFELIWSYRALTVGVWCPPTPDSS